MALYVGLEEPMRVERRHVVDAGRIILDQLVHPFGLGPPTRSALSSGSWVPTLRDLNFQTLCICIPAIYGLLMFSLAELGMLPIRALVWQSLRETHWQGLADPFNLRLFAGSSVPFALAYALLAASLLLWEARSLHLLWELAAWRQTVGLPSSEGRSSAAEKVYSIAHGIFLELFKRHECRKNDVASGGGLTCLAQNSEAKLMTDIYDGVCQMDYGATEAFQACVDYGGRRRLMSSAQGTEGDDIFCQCWTAVFDSIHGQATLGVFWWCCLFLGVLATMYVIIERGFARMGSAARFEFIGFVLVGSVLLVYEVMDYVEDHPLLG